MSSVSLHLKISGDQENNQWIVNQALGHFLLLLLDSLRRLAFGHMSKQGSFSVVSFSGSGGRMPNLNCQVHQSGSQCYDHVPIKYKLTFYIFSCHGVEL